MSSSTNISSNSCQQVAHFFESPWAGVLENDVWALSAHRFHPVKHWPISTISLHATLKRNLTQRSVVLATSP